MHMNVATDFLSSAIRRFQEYKTLGEKSMAQLSDAELHWQPNAETNSIAIIIQHLHGNMLSRWTNFLTEDGEKPWRSRDAEFEAASWSKGELMERWNEGWKVLIDALESLWEEDLLRTVTIRSKPLSVIDAINRQLAHYSYHIGQIVLIAKWLKGAEWETLSIARGQSDQYNAAMKS